MRVISTFTDWSIKSISIKSILTIYIDLSIDKLVSIFIDWLRRGMGKHDGQNNIVRGWGGGQFVHDSRCPILAVILENRRIWLKSFVRGCPWYTVAYIALASRVKDDSASFFPQICYMYRCFWRFQKKWLKQLELMYIEANNVARLHSGVTVSRIAWQLHQRCVTWL